MKVSDIVTILDAWAPFETAEDFDNVGLLVGDASEEVRGILIALDVTEDVIDEAAELGANLIVSHHPVIFHAMKAVTPYIPQGNVVGKLLRSGISVISAHTNLDMAEGGVSEALAEAIGLKDIRTVSESEFMRVGELEEAMTPQAFAKSVMERLGARHILAAGPAPEKIKTVCVLSGSGGSFLTEALSVGADVFLTGEARHDSAINAASLNVYMMAAGHYETEAVVLTKIRACLQKHAYDVQSKDGINISMREKNPFDLIL